MSATDQQHHSSNVNTLLQPTVPAATNIDSLTCQWQGCTERAVTPEALYEHVCERYESLSHWKKDALH